MIRLLIDSSSLCYRAFHSTGTLSHGDRATGIPFGFLHTLLMLSERYRTNQFTFCWDSPSSKRKKIYPGYKSKRNELTPEERAERQLVHDQINALREDILPPMGFGSHALQDGYEADDLIADIAKREADRVKPIPLVGVSGDADLLQLLRFRSFRLYVPVSGKEWSASKFQMEYGIPCREWVTVKCIAGCPGDSVPGIRGVKEKTAIQYIKGELKSGGVKWKAIEAGGSIIARNYPLVQLPFPGVQKISFQEDRFDKQALFGMFKDLGFASFLQGEAKVRWEAFLIHNAKMEDLF